MKTWIFICMSIAMLLWFLSTLRRKPSQKKGCIDAIIPAYGNDSNLLIVFYVQIMPDDFVMQLHRF